MTLEIRPPSTEPLLVAQDLTKSYGATQAVRGVSFLIPRGEIFGLLGPNGAGKTTTISMLSGLITPDQGSVRVNGLDFRTTTSAAKARIGLVPQELALYPTLSAFDNLAFFGRIYGLRGQRLRMRIAAVLELVGLADRARDTVASFSGGMKRRVNIAAGLLHEPDILFLDEPTVGVDPQSRNAIFEGIEALNRAGLTILYTTHYMEEAQRLCRRVAIMDQGRIIALDTPDALVRGLGGSSIRIGLQNGYVDQVGAAATGLAAVTAVHREEDRLRIETTDPQQTLTSLVDITNRLGAHMTALQIVDPTLETVFLHLTGKQLRD